MLRKNLIAFSLIAMTTFGITVSNTTISIAAPTKAESSNDIMQEIKTRRFRKLEKLISAEAYIEAVDLRNEVQDQLTALSKSGNDVTYLQREFNELSRRIDGLRKTKKEMAEIKKDIRLDIDELIFSLYNKNYTYTTTALKSLAENMSILEKQEPIDWSILSKLENSICRDINKDFLKQAENIVSSIETQLDNLSGFIKEKNISKSISAKKQLTSDIRKLDDLLKVPEFIKKNFDLCCDKLDELVVLREEALILKN